MLKGAEAWLYLLICRKEWLYLHTLPGLHLELIVDQTESLACSEVTCEPARDLVSTVSVVHPGG